MVMIIGISLSFLPIYHYTMKAFYFNHGFDNCCMFLIAKARLLLADVVDGIDDNPTIGIKISMKKVFILSNLGLVYDRQQQKINQQ